MNGIRKLLLCGVLLACMVTSHAKGPVGFFAPEGVGDYHPRMDFSLVNVYLDRSSAGSAEISVHRVLEDFNKVKNSDHQIHLDLGPSLARPRSPEKLKIAYEQRQGGAASKSFTPLPANKLRDFLSPEEIKKLLGPLASKLRNHQRNLGCIFVADEPYLAGISRQQYDEVSRLIRRIFAEQGIPKICIGVIFASALFDPAFAKHIDTQMMSYVQDIDSYYQTQKPLLTVSGKAGEQARAWLRVIGDKRLSTYDQAGNIYTGGGIPAEVDMVTFDFYLSTLLLDGVHNRTLDWMGKNFPKGPCGPFQGVAVSQIRQKLSFFGGLNGRAGNAQALDKKILDGVFECRISTATDMLEYHLTASGKAATVKMLIGESSANGLLQFDATGNIIKTQQPKRIELRMADEVGRYADFFACNANRFQGGLMYFTDRSTYDSSIRLHVGGADGYPSIMRQIHQIRSGPN